VRNLHLLLLLVISASCNQSKNPNADGSSSYAVVNDWPQLPPNFPQGQVSAVGIDTSQNVFVFQRTGRVWKGELPDSVISLNTVFLLEKETGRVLSSWGANLFVMPHGLTVDKNNNVWVTDVALNQVFKFSHEGKLLLTLGIPKAPGNDSIHFNRPTDVAIAADGSLFISDGYRNSRVAKFSSKGKFLFDWGQKGVGPGAFDIPHSIALDSHGNVFVADRENNRIQEFDAKGTFVNVWKNSESGRLFALCVSKTDEVFAVDAPNVNDSVPRESDILRLDPKLNLIERLGRTGIKIPSRAFYHDVAVDDLGNIYTANSLGNSVQKFSKASRKSD